MVYIDCRNFMNMDAFYDALQKKLNLPDYFGRNLDALNDVLYDVEEEVLLCFDGYDLFASRVGEKAEKAREIIIDVSDSKPNLQLMFEK